ncbi:hypothetical protein CRM22_008158 [Opisthorchis felineus]|uniref:Myb-like domain-containing protein n=1 Tax=Opisthorchis felineus TaxID=147828 RepID=A0A4S2LEM7_OPIFE|nr:hypothetical protein CRM22_008158 [Opisthorchis felineus]
MSSDGIYALLSEFGFPTTNGWDASNESKLHMLNEVIALLELSDTVDLDAGPADRFNVLLASLVVERLLQFRELVTSHDACRSQESTSARRRNLLLQIHKCAVRSITLLAKLITAVSPSNLSRDKIKSQLDIILRVTSMHPHKWTDYLNKLQGYCTSLCQEVVFNSRSISASTSNTEGTNDAMIHDDPHYVMIPYSELQQLVFAELASLDQAKSGKTDADTSVSSKWQRAYEVSGVLDILRTVSATVRHPAVKHTVSTFTGHPVGVGTNDPLSEALLSEVKAHLLEMRGLHSQWSNQPDSSVTRTSVNRSSVTTPVTRTANEVHSHRSRSQKASGRLLLPNDHFERFIGSSDTPRSTPPTVPQSTTREVIKLPTPLPGQKRVPFTLEESLALWQGFIEHRDAVDCWVRVWRQSFRRSGRRPVDLKDRWRVIQRSATLNRTIAEAYEQWKSEKECNNRVPTLIIVRSS